MPDTPSERTHPQPHPPAFSDAHKPASPARVVQDHTLKSLMESYIGRITPEQQVVSVRQAWQELWLKAAQYLPKDELHRLGEAFVQAAMYHSAGFRHSGEPYIVHTISAAAILAEMKLDANTLIAALLHDTIEDTSATFDDLKERFGVEVATLVDGVTKLGVLPFKSVEDYQAENLRKMFLVMAKDIRVVLIKLADRLHNMRTIQGHPKREKQIAIAKETTEIYAPLAHRLGIYHIKRELEDIAFRILDPDMYYDIKRRLRKRLPECETVIKSALETLQQKLKEEGINAYLSGRTKHHYSIYEKMRRKNLTLEQLYDLLALRVIVDTMPDCYHVLGLVHSIWKPIPGQFDDYIANPKNNMYQSLHTTVVGPHGDPLEIQIRDWDMHWMAEYGIASHWQYKGVKRPSDASLDEKLTWIRQALEFQGENSESPREFLDQLKTDVLTSDVFVFTPQGDVVTVPVDSTPIDFAYTIHTAVGQHCVGAMVNNRIVSMDYTLQNGDIVRILTSPQAKPSRDWLKIAKSSRTRTKIRLYFRQQDRAERDEKLQRGRDLLERELQRRYPENTPTLESFQAQMSHLANDIGYTGGADEVIVAVGTGHQTPGGIIARLSDRAPQQEKTPPAKEPSKKSIDSEIVVEGAEGVLVTLAQCCMPIPGDAIIGCVTLNRGITVHREDCPNVGRVEADRRVSVAWNVPKPDFYTARLKLVGIDQMSLFQNIQKAVTATEARLYDYNFKGGTHHNRRAYLTADVQVKDLEHLYRVFAKLGLVDGVIEVVRA